MSVAVMTDLVEFFCSTIPWPEVMYVAPCPYSNWSVCLAVPLSSTLALVSYFVSF